ncbi:30S ribosome-binding factor RbfA [Caldithrix abyssi]|uniref:Ribosome-binding factor A n=1 Tax=Caldithrix abyssi DSM 13497 TaxID=880073 RepID=H1XXM7_CALAY|nr:30S ribosome-binding factor RbfA [Caldithrix abyssi]APF19240.1 rbfA ribosome-binding factor A [Caldithrix abyssi DSM 13497]EHO43151.1 Ribosome-binding factor A [Caldithrix abyssi DSM 13497]
MAEGRRVKRYADLIKRVVSEVIEFKLNDPNKGMVTLTRVKVSPDLRIATIYYTVLGDEKQRAKTKEVLNRSRSFIRSEIKPFITSRWLPELRFFYDETMDYAERIDSLLKSIKNDADSEEE